MATNCRYCHDPIKNAEVAATGVCLKCRFPYYDRVPKHGWKGATCRCGRPLSERYAQEMGMCVECKLQHIRRFKGEVRLTDDKTLTRARRNMRTKHGN
jgi:hypothetical protein